jgi:uncharacterized damage-inducible protein DinB
MRRSSNSVRLRSGNRQQTGTVQEQADASAAELVRLISRGWQNNVRRYFTRVSACLEQLSDEEIWWRPNAASNSAGNLALHMTGSLGQWVVSGLGGVSRRRDRDQEFAERGPIPRSRLIRRLRGVVNEACRVFSATSPQTLCRTFRIGDRELTGYDAAADAVVHFAHHAGQILYLTKRKRGKHLGFTAAVGSSRGQRKK